MLAISSPSSRALAPSTPWMAGPLRIRVQKTGRENINAFMQQYAEFYASEGSLKSKIFDVERCFGVRKLVPN